MNVGSGESGLITFELMPLLDASFRHRFVIPTNAGVGASRVKGRLLFWHSHFCFRQIKHLC